MPVKRVLIVDDSALMRAMLSDIISNDSRFIVCGVAEDAYVARDMVKSLNPDVLTLDIEMPDMSGLTFLRNLMRLRPIPVIMISTLTQVGAPETLEALALGAVDFVCKPLSHDDMLSGFFRDQVIQKLLAATQANIELPSMCALPAHSAQGKPPKIGRICVIGSSTGGTEAIKQVLMLMPSMCPPIVVAQHIPEGFSASLAQRLNDCCAVTVCEASQGQLLEAGHVYIAKGGQDLVIDKVGSKLRCSLHLPSEKTMYCPSVDRLFDSVLYSVGSNAVPVLLTGMGNDGADAMKRMRDQGCYTLVQNEETSVVWGMPGSAVKNGGATEQAPLYEIASKIISRCY